jgi:hypothetical protein
MASDQKDQNDTKEVYAINKSQLMKLMHINGKYKDSILCNILGMRTRDVTELPETFIVVISIDLTDDENTFTFYYKTLQDLQTGQYHVCLTDRDNKGYHLALGLFRAIGTRVANPVI